MNLIKTLTRLKYIHVRDTGEPAPDSICYDAIENYERGLLKPEMRAVGSEVESNE